ncbi:MAG: hypothetical protein F6K47_02520 [Symploca sp. SIO2E6]|nr:hypothetical protein [Symploca sp. SIO2E6]
MNQHKPKAPRGGRMREIVFLKSQLGARSAPRRALEKLGNGEWGMRNREVDLFLIFFLGRKSLYCSLLITHYSLLITSYFWLHSLKKF